MIIPYTEQNLNLIKAAILAGEVVAFPTDTLFALACDATNSEAIKKLFALKKRPIERTAPVLVASLKHGMKYARFNETATRLANHFWPGAFTMVLPALEDGALSELAIRNGTVGLRVPDSHIALSIIEACVVPLLGTSANLSDNKDLNDAKEIYDTLGPGLLVVEPETNPKGMPSTIVKVDEEIQILRIGAISEEEILSFHSKAVFLAS